MHRMLLAAMMAVLALAPLTFAQSKTVRIGMSTTFLTDKPKSYIDIATNDFKEVMQKSTGLDGEVDTKIGPFEVAARLDKKQLDFGIFHAHEFAWVRTKHPDLQPVLIAATKGPVERACIIVQKANPAKSIADLRGKKLDLPSGAGEPCRLFLAKVCQNDAKKSPADFFSAIAKAPTQADALDEVARGNAQAAVIDSFALAFYKDVKGPVFEKNLRLLVESEPFPPAVIVCKKGAVDEANMKAFVNGLRKAHEIPQGRDMMKAWNMEAFEPIPKNYDKSLADIMKAYPSPSSR